MKKLLSTFFLIPAALGLRKARDKSSVDAASNESSDGTPESAPKQSVQLRRERVVRRDSIRREARRTPIFIRRKKSVDDDADASHEAHHPRPKLRRLWRKTRILIKLTALEWSQDNILRLSAALSYFSVFAISPLLVIVLMICGRIYGEDAARGELHFHLAQVMGERPSQLIEQMLVSAMKPNASSFASALGVFVLIFGATGFFVALKDALNQIWGIRVQPNKASWLVWLEWRLLSFGLLALIMLLLLFSLGFSTVLSFASRFLNENLAINQALWSNIGAFLPIPVQTVLFAALFRFVPDIRYPWRDIWPGAFLTAVLFEIGKWFLAQYLGNQSLASSYGVAGALMLILLWVYYSAIILLSGAEFTQVLSRLRSGKGFH